ncbi:hypothetical protein TNCV_536231 [Trichonephila clavipes]|nr:hypothetical protein TNCV_536231 [Trichonephila clavipes]
MTYTRVSKAAAKRWVRHLDDGSLVASGLEPTTRGKQRWPLVHDYDHSTTVGTTLQKNSRQHEGNWGRNFHHGQVKRTPELATFFPNFHTTAMGGLSLDRFNVHQLYTRGITHEFMTMTTRLCDEQSST